MSETVRDVMIIMGLIISFIGAFWLVAHAFRESFFWGMASLITLPVFCSGGLLYGIMHFYQSARPFLVSSFGLALLFLSLLFFPREPLVGYWFDQDTKTVYEFKKGGVLRNYDLDEDCSWNYRPFKLFTAELPVLSQTRINVSGHSEFDLAYYYPKKGEVIFYEEIRDPELIINPKSSGPEPNTYIKIRDVNNPDFQNLLAHYERREVVKNSFYSMLDDIKNGRDTASYIHHDVIRQYTKITQLVVAAKREDIRLLSPIEQNFIHHLRASHSQLLTGSRISTIAIIQAEMQCGYFGLINLPEGTVQDVLLTDNGKEGYINLAMGPGMPLVRMRVQNLDGKGYRFKVSAVRESFFTGF